MKACKIMLKIETETLSVESIPGLLQMVIMQMQKEFEGGMLRANDGDTVTWSVNKDTITF